eukprot:scaffold98368_cov61-Phaeocystis_antarctica.AAC.1
MRRARRSGTEPSRCFEGHRDGQMRCPRGTRASSECARGLRPHRPGRPLPRSLANVPRGSPRSVLHESLLTASTLGCCQGELSAPAPLLSCCCQAACLAPQSRAPQS